MLFCGSFDLFHKDRFVAVTDDVVEINVPVELHSAKKRSAELDMTMLDKRDLSPVGYKRVNKSSGKDVPWGDIVKGYEYKDDQYVVMSDEDFRRANPEASKTVDILAFVELADIEPQYFDTPYYLKPEKRGDTLRDVIEREFGMESTRATHKIPIKIGIVIGCVHDELRDNSRQKREYAE